MPHRRKGPLDLAPIERAYLDSIKKAGSGGSGGGSGRAGTGGGLAVLAILVVGFFAAVLDTPETDGIRPAGISEEAFERNPTAGKVKIEKCGSYYKYYDLLFMRQVGYGRSRPNGYTFSSTPPHAEVDHITEGTTVLVRGIGPGRVVSTGRRIPRENVMPVEHGFGNYMMSGGEKIPCEDFYYTPPSTASAAEQRLVR